MRPELAGPVLLKGAAAIAVVYALTYLLKIRERRIPVSQSFLWDRVISAGEKALWARILRRFISLLIQLAIAYLVLGALADPRPAAKGPQGQSLLLLVDTSASMNTRDASPTRWDSVMEEVEMRLQGLGQGDEVALVTYASSPRVVVSWTKDVRRVVLALRRIRPTDEPSDHGRALRFARTLLLGRPNPSIAWVTDGQGKADGVTWPPIPQQCPTREGMPLEGMRLMALLPDYSGATTEGRSDHGFTAFSVRPRPQDPGTGDVFMEVRRLRGEARAYVDLYVDGNWRDRVEVRDATMTRIFPIPLGGTRIRAALAPASTTDVLASNDEAFAATIHAMQPKIALVGEENLFLEAALLLTGGTLKTIPADEYTEKALDDCDGDECNVVVFNEFAPSRLPRVRNQIYIHPPGGGPFRPVRVHRQNLQILWTASHPIMRAVSMEDVNLWGRWYSFSPGPNDVPLMQIDERGTVVAMLRQTEGRRMVVLGIPLRGSDFVLLPSFPVWILNTIGWMMGTSPDTIASVPTGTLVRLDDAADTLEGPSLHLTGTIRQFTPSRRGFYTAFRHGQEIAAVGASLLDAQEGDPHVSWPTISCRKVPKWEKAPVVRARQSRLPVGTLLMVFGAGLGLLVMARVRGIVGAALALAGLATIASGTAALALLTGLDVWIALLAAGAVMLALEWITYHRRITV